MSNPYLGEIRIFPYNFPPNGWMECNGQTLPISQYNALFALIGTTYGGNGTTNFQLPNLQSRVPIHAGQGAGLSPYVLGEMTGTETVTLNQNQLPSHTHPLNANTEPAVSDIPTGGVLAGGLAYSPSASNTAMGATAVGNTGGNQPFTVVQPVLAFTICIAIVGIFPSRN